MAKTLILTRCFSLNSAVRGHHVYKTIWLPSIGEELETSAEENNPNDSFAVAVIKGLVVGQHSRAFWHFIRRGGTIKARITRNREFSRDLTLVSWISPLLRRGLSTLDVVLLHTLEFQRLNQIDLF